MALCHSVLVRLCLVRLLNQRRRFLLGKRRPPSEVKEWRRHCARECAGKRIQRHRSQRELWRVSDHPKGLTQSCVKRNRTGLAHCTGNVSQTCTRAITVNVIIAFVFAVTLVAALLGHPHNVVEHRVQFGCWRCRHRKLWGRCKRCCPEGISTLRRSDAKGGASLWRVHRRKRLG